MVKPKTNDELEEFWKTVDAAKCQRYISHIKNVIPKLKGAATGY